MTHVYNSWYEKNIYIYEISAALCTMLKVVSQKALAYRTCLAVIP